MTSPAPAPVSAIAAPARAAAGAFIALLALYFATLAPGVTFWDSGEFISAIHTLGIPHPPGTPLYVILGHAWTLAFPGLGIAFATNLLSAVFTAAAGGIVAWLVARWTHRALLGVGAAVSAGAGYTVWASATETEVYAASLLLAMAMMLAGSAAARPGREDPIRAGVVLAYLFGLAGPLHPSALLAAPAAAMLAAQRKDGTTDWLLFAQFGGLALVAAGAALVAPWFAMLGMATVVGTVLAGAVQGRPFAARVVASLGAVALGATPWIILYIRARHDPSLNQGNPSDWASFIAVVRRDQYLVAATWPRNAPLWMQLANVLQYADWQFAIGLSPHTRFSPLRFLVSLVYVGLGVAGAAEHRARHRPSWRGMLLLLLSGTVGAAAQLNLKAGPSMGYGILPADALHEARERDYFFVLGFWVWGAWAALGAWRVARRFGPARDWAVVVVAAVAIVCNWPMTNRRGQPESRLPRAFAASLLRPLPPKSVLFVAGDNDTYPLWYLQQVEQFRPDIVVVTIPLLGADWYRDELHRRHRLADPAAVRPWRGTRDAIARISELSVALGRDVVVDVSVSAGDRGAAGSGWRYWGLVYLRTGTPGLTRDARRIEQTATDVAAALAWGSPRGTIDDTPQYIRSLLRCPVAAEAGVVEGPLFALLASTCNFR